MRLCNATAAATSTHGSTCVGGRDGGVGPERAERAGQSMAREPCYRASCSARPMCVAVPSYLYLVLYFYFFKKNETMCTAAKRIAILSLYTLYKDT